MSLFSLQRSFKEKFSILGFLGKYHFITTLDRDRGTGRGIVLPWVEPGYLSPISSLPSLAKLR